MKWGRSSRSPAGQAGNTMPVTERIASSGSATVPVRMYSWLPAPRKSVRRSSKNRTRLPRSTPCGNTGQTSRLTAPPSMTAKRSSEMEPSSKRVPMT